MRQLTQVTAAATLVEGPALQTVTKPKTTRNGKVYRMSNTDVRSDARPFTTPHQAGEMDRDEEEEYKDKKDKERKKKDPSRTPGNPPILASQLQPKTASAEERLLKTLKGEEEEEEGSSDEEGGSSSDDIRERTERALRLCDQQQKEEDEPAAAAGHHPGPHLTLVQNKTVFGTINGDVYIGGGGGGRAVVQQSAAPTSEGKKPWVSLTDEEKAHIKRCAQSRRMVEEADLLQIASKIGKDWKSVEFTRPYALKNPENLNSSTVWENPGTFVRLKHLQASFVVAGNGLKLNHSCLDLIESECSSLVERIEMMLYRWMQWKCERATVARLTKALYNHNEYAAVLIMQP